VAIAQENAVKYFGLADEYSTKENSKAVILPAPYEATTSYGKGAKDGPQAILSASQKVELFDDELWTMPYKIGIQSMPSVEIETTSNEKESPFDELYDAVKPVVEFDKFPIVIGGERSVTIGAVRACIERFPDLSILHIGAHTDLRETFEDSHYSHACVNFQLYNMLPQPLITSVGVRNISEEEVAWLEQKQPNVNLFWARNQDGWNLNEIVETLSDNVYLTVDVSGLDPAIMPATGAPEPGGMGWYQITELIKLLCIRKNVVGADFVELAPIPNLLFPEFTIAKLIYKTIGYRFAMELGVTKKYL
jgi:agmatinase